MEIKLIAFVCVISAALCTGCLNRGRIYRQNPPGNPNINGGTASVPTTNINGGGPLSNNNSNIGSNNGTNYADTYKIKAKNGIVRRPNGIYDTEGSLTWSVEKDGEIVLERNAIDEFELDPLWLGNGHYRIWLKAYLSNGYDRVSNIVEFDAPITEIDTTEDPEFDLKAVENTKYINTYTITAENGLVTRTEGIYDSNNLGWTIVFNGDTKLERLAENEFSYRPSDYGEGKYEVWLTAFIDGGYKRVSNKVSWETPLDINEADAKIIELKSKMKSLIQHITSADGGQAYDLEYKCGFVIDPDHDGEYDACVYYAGTDQNGNEQQLIFENGSYWIRFSTLYQQDNGQSYRDGSWLYIWCDEVSGKDYIVRCTSDTSGNILATDCCTNEEIYNITNGQLTLFGQKTADKSVIEKGKYYFRSAAPSDKDCFYVSKNGKAEKEGA